MSVSVQIYNLRQTRFAHPEFALINSLATKTKTLKRINADDYAVDYGRLGGFGVAIIEDGTAHSGTLVTSVTATLTTEQTVIATTTGGGNVTINLPDLTLLDVGYRIWVYFRTKNTNNVIVDGYGGQQVLGANTQTLSSAGSVLRIQNDGSAWVTPTSLA